MHAGVLSFALITLLAASASAQPASVPIQPRDAPPPAGERGTASIAGRVYSAEGGTPIRRAFVMLMPVAGMSAPRAGAPPAAAGAPGAGSGGGAIVSGGIAAVPPGASVIIAPSGSPIPMMSSAHNTATDAAGRFEFKDLPAGSYRLRVAPHPYSAQYVGAMYGGGGPADQGAVIELKDGQRFDRADVPLQRGGAITGRVVDEAGEPLTRVMVFASRLVPGTSRTMRMGGGLIQTDDHGRFRIYGLEAGDYIVTAEARNMGGPPVDTSQSEAFVTTFHPAATDERSAARVAVRAGADVDGIDIQMVRTRAYRITGNIVDSQGRPVAAPNVMLARVNPGGGWSSNGFPVDPAGRFTIRDVAPGDYTIVVRPRFEEPGSETAKVAAEYASVPVTVAEDVEDLVIITQPGVTIAGQLVFATGDPERGGTVRVSAQPGQRLPAFGMPPTSTVGADGRFTLNNVAGPVLIRPMLPREWALKAVMLGATDITHTPVELRKEHSGHLQVVVSTRPASIEGTVTGDEGKPAEQAAVLVFPEDRAAWQYGSPHVRQVMAGKEGRFVASGLPGGRYFAVAGPARSFTMTPDVTAEFFESLTRDATRVVVADDERRVVDLRLTTPGDR